MDSRVTRKPRAASAFFIAISFLVSACGGGAPGAPAAASAPGSTTAAATTPPRAKVRLALPVPAPDPGQIWAFVPTGAKYFEQENLEVEFLPTAGGAANIKLVATGGAEFAISSPDNTLNATLEGLDLKGIATVVTRQIFRIVVAPNSPITTYAQLKGRKVGVSALTSGAYPFARYAFQENGLSPDKDIEFVTVGTGGPALEALKSGKVDALSTWDTQIAIHKELGTTVRILPESTNVGLPADLVLVSSAYLTSNPDVVVRFTRAVLKGIVYAQANPGRATDFFIQQFPDAAKARPRDGHLNALTARLGNMTLIPAQQGKWGYVPLDLYGKLQDAGVSLAVIKQKQDLSKIFTNELSDRILSFKVADVERDAKAP